MLAVLTSCDPTYPITITNNSNVPKEILVRQTSLNFTTDKEKVYTTPNGFDVYILAPSEQMNVGTAIAEFDNDLPFEEIKIVRKTDTISASGLEQIRVLFDMDDSGDLLTPYNISIK